jgi:hypothetical protein
MCAALNRIYSDFSVAGYSFKNFISNEKILTFSLRMHPQIDYCYTTKQPAPAPILKDLVWNWRNSRPSTDWSYPMSVDGHIFRANEILPIVFQSNFNNPNTFEGVLASYAAQHIIKSDLMCGVDVPILVNNPANKVQTLNNNHFGLEHSFPTEELNKQFLSGKHIDILNSVANIKKYNAPHIEFPIILY